MTPLSTRVYTLLKTVPKGRVTTYKALGVALKTKAYRAIGQILRHNPYAPIVPCHRVVASDGTLGGFNGATKGPHMRKKIALLREEGVQVKNNHIIDFRSILFTFQIPGSRQ